MKLIYLLIPFLLLGVESKGQTILSNGDFESYTLCPTNTSEFDYLTSWRTTITNPDYYNCTFTMFPIVPSNGLAYSGTGFVGLGSYNTTDGSAEAFGQQLMQPMLPSKVYEISFAAKRASSGEYSGNCLGIEIYGFERNYPVLWATIHTSSLADARLLASTPNVTDSVWKIHKLYITPLDTMNFIVFTVHKKSKCGEYVFIDGVSLAESDISLSIKRNYLDNAGLKIFPNPVSNNLRFESEFEIPDLHLTIYNTLGQEVCSKQKISLKEEVDISFLKTGVYYVNFKSEQGAKILKLLKE